MALTALDPVEDRNGSGGMVDLRIAFMSRGGWAALATVCLLAGCIPAPQRPMAPAAVPPPRAAPRASVPVMPMARAPAPQTRSPTAAVPATAIPPASVPASVPRLPPVPAPPRIPPVGPSAEPAAVRSDAPADLQNAVQALGHAFEGAVGIAVRDIDDGWIVSFRGETARPQQSVSKLWVGIAVLDAVDRGALSLNDPVTVRKSDLTVFHQPIRALIGPDGYRTTIGTLLECAMTRSDNTCNDVLLWKVGGPTAIRSMLSRKGISGVTFGPGERLLQARTAGLTWRQDWAGGAGFLEARAKMSYEARNRALQRYLAAPYDGASANGVTLGLTLLERGDLLSSGSTAHLLALMRASKTGPTRMRAGLRSGWTLAHKTGTGQDLGTLATGYNDVGVLTAPNGRRYAVAVMIASTRRPIPARQRLMADVVRAVIATNG